MPSSGDVTALDIVTVVIAGYAAVVGTFALAFQAVTWWRSWATRVAVKLSISEIHQAGVEPETIVVFHMVNHSAHPVKIIHVGFDRQTRGGSPSFIYRPLPVHQPLPIEIPPRDAQQVWTTPDAVRKTMDPTRKFRAQVGTADRQSGETR